MAAEDWKDKSIPQPDIVATQDSKFIKTFQKYDLNNPHPGYGTDPNIINHYGHTIYPKMIYPNGNNEPGMIVNNEEEEKAALPASASPPTETKSKAKKDW